MTLLRFNAVATVFWLERAEVDRDIVQLEVISDLVFMSSKVETSKAKWFHC